MTTAKGKELSEDVEEMLVVIGRFFELKISLALWAREQELGELMNSSSVFCDRVEPIVGPEDALGRDLCASMEMSHGFGSVVGAFSVERIDEDKPELAEPTVELYEELDLLDRMQKAGYTTGFFRNHYDALARRVQKCLATLRQKAKEDSAIRKVVEYFIQRLRTIDATLLEPITA